MKLRLVNAALLGFYAALWIGGLVSHFLWQRTPPGAGWTASAFLACAAALLLLNQSRERCWLAAVGVVGFLAELAGSKLPLLFGPYSYSGVLQPQLAGVPVVMAFAWLTLMAYVKSGLTVSRLGHYAGVGVGAFWMAAIDLVIDPVATLAFDYWHWHEPGRYYGVPVSNFVGWLVVSAVLLASGVNLRIEGRLPRFMGLSILVFFGAVAAAHGIPAPVVVSLALCGLHLWLGHKSSSGGAAGTGHFDHVTGSFQNRSASVRRM